MVAVAGCRCCCSTGSAPIGSWQSRSLKHLPAPRPSSLTCPVSAVHPGRCCHIARQHWRGWPPALLRSSATQRLTSPASPGAVESRSSSRINIQSCAGGWCSPRPRPVSPWCRRAPLCCGKFRMIDDGHLFIVTRPAETAGIIEAFLADASRQVEPSSPLTRIANSVRGLVPTFRGRRDAQAPRDGEPHQS